MSQQLDLFDEHNRKFVQRLVDLCCGRAAPYKPPKKEPKKRKAKRK